MFICHVSIIQPDLSARLEWIFRHAHNDRGFPIGETRQISGVGRDDARDANIGPGENINSLMQMIPTHRIAPQESDKAVCGKMKRRRSALRTGSDFPVEMRSRIPNPLTEFISPGGIRSMQEVKVCNPC